MTVTHRPAQDFPESRSFTILQDTYEIRILTTSTNAVMGQRLTAMTICMDDTVKSHVLYSTNVRDAQKFISAFWDIWSKAPNYTLMNLTTIGKQTGRLFPEISHRSSFLNWVKSTCQLQEEEFTAFCNGIDPHLQEKIGKMNIGVIDMSNIPTEEHNDEDHDFGEPVRALH